MSKKSKKSLILLAGVLSFSALGLASCGEQPHEPDNGGEVTPVEKVTKLTIANKTALTAPWKVGEADRTVELTIAPATIKADDPRITVTSSAPDIVKVTGRTLKAVKAGRAEITVKADEQKAKVLIIVEAPEVVVTAVSIKNKTDLEQVWHVGDSTREIVAATTPETNIADLVKDEIISVTSSNTDAVTVAGLILSPVGIGESTITLKYAKGETTFTDDVKVTVSDLEPVTIAEAFADAFNDVKASKGKSKGAYKVVAKAVATNGKDDLVIWDGTNFAAVRGEAAKTAKVGKTYTFQTGISNFYGNLQFDGGKPITEVTPETPIADPIETPLTVAKIAEYKASAILVNSEIPSVDKIHYPVYGPVEAMFVKIREDKDYYYFKPTLAEGETFDADDYIKTDKDITTKLHSKITIGETVKITGAFNQYNSGSKYFNLIPSKIEHVKDPIAPTSISFTEDFPTTLKQYQQIDVSKMYKFDNDLAAAKVTYKIVDADNIVLDTDLRLLPTKAGTFTVQFFANEGKENEIKTEIKTVTVTAEKATNALSATREVKTIKEITSMPVAKDATKLYEVTGQLVKGSATDIYGNTKIADAEGNTLSTYGMAMTLNAFVLGEDGNIDFMKNPKEFGKNFGADKAVQLGDIVKLAVLKDEHDGEHSFKTSLLEVVTPAEEQNFTIELPEGITADKTGTSFKYGTELVLTLNDANKNMLVAVNDLVINPEADGTYKVTVLPIITKVTLVKPFELPAGCKHVLTAKPANFTYIDDVAGLAKYTDLTKSGGVKIESIVGSKFGIDTEGFKFGNAKNPGSVTFTYAETVNIKKVVLLVKGYSESKDSKYQVTIGDQVIEAQTAKKTAEFVELTFELTTAVDTTTVKVESLKESGLECRAFFSAISLY